MPLDRHLRVLVLSACLLPTVAQAQTAEAPESGMPPTVVPPQAMTRASGPITVDGDVSDAAWSTAVRFDQFYETSPSDNIPAKVQTIA